MAAADQSELESIIRSTGFYRNKAKAIKGASAAIVEHFGPSPRAFLVVPIVGGFLVDFTNALITTASINLVR